MFSQLSSRRRIGVFVFTALFLVGLLAQTAPAAEPIGETSSLKFVPADTSFYCTLLRNRQKYDAVAKSNVVKRVLNIPEIKAGLAFMQLRWNDDNPVKAFLDQPENAKLLPLLKDMVSNEVFFYGGDGYGELLALANEMNRLNQTIMLGAVPGDDPSVEMVKKFTELFAKNSDKLNVPDTVIGFKLTDPKSAKAELDRLEKFLSAMLAANPELKMRFQKQKIAGGDFLVFTFDGTMIPWDEVPLDEVPEESKKDVDKLIDMIKKKTLVVSLGIRDDYALLSIAESTDHLKALGQGKLLIDRKEFAALRKQGDKPITSISYVSQEFMKSAGSGKKAIDDLVSMAEMAIPLSDLDEDLAAELIVDAKALGKDLKKFVPQQGAQMSYSFFTDSGFEGYTYNWSENLILDGSKKLTILDHLGGDPLIYAAARQKSSVEGYSFLVKWSKRSFYYLDYFAQQEMDDEDLKKYKQFKTAVTPLVKRFDETTAKMLIPALADGQSALVIDAKLKSKQWHEMMPPSSKPLPMLELGLVYGVSDSGLLKQAFSAYFDIAQQVANKLHEIEPDKIPEVKFVKPKEREFSSGTVYYYTFLKKMGFDQRIALNAGLSDDFAAVSMLPLHTKRLLDENPLPTDRLSADRNRPLAAASGLNFAGLIDAVTPWVDYAFDVSQEREISTQGEDLDFMQQIKGHVHTALEILKCFRGFSSVTYLEDDAKVTHYELNFEDLKQ